MQNLESSCQEADTIINDTLLKLKGSALQASSSGYRQSHMLQTQTLHRFEPLHQQSHHNFLRQAPSYSGLQPLSHQPPPYLFDGPESPSEYIAGDHALLSSGGTLADTEQQISLSTPLMLSNINSIISPPSVVPDMLLNASSTSPTLNCLKPEKRSLLSPTSTIDNQLCNSSPSKKPKLNSLAYVEGATSSSSVGSSLFQPLLSSSNSLGINSNNVKIPSLCVSSSSSCTTSQQHTQSIGKTKYDLPEEFKSTKVVFSTSVAGNLPNHCSSNTGSSSGFVSTSNPTMRTSQQSNMPTNNSGRKPTYVVPPATTKYSNSSAFFDIHDKMRELYLYLLIHDEKGLKESRKRHRSRSFVLERLVEREKLNIVVLNLYPGNKGYSLAFYQDNNHMEVLNESSQISTNDCPRNITMSGDSRGGAMTYDSSGGSQVFIGVSGINKSVKQETNIGNINRLKQASINSKCMSDRHDKIDINCDATIGMKSTVDRIDNYNVGANSLTADENIIGRQCGGGSNAALDSNQDKDDDDNLVEVMSWPYEVEDMLNSIDKEELPIFISDLLETRMPNVFYSGCVICQVRDYRQTFPISSNSCDIYHVMLKPTNEMLYSDINQISIETGISNVDKLFLESQLILATSEPLCLDPDPRIGQYAINSQHRKQMWNTSPLRRQMKKYSQISINRKRKIDQFTHHYGLELCDYLQRRPRSLSSLTNGNIEINRTTSTVSSTVHMYASINKVQKKCSEIFRPIRAPKYEYPSLLDPGNIEVLRLAKEYPQKGREVKEDFLPILVEEYTLESDREYGHIYLIKLSIYKRPATMEYLGELYVDRQGGEHKGESCRFSLGTRAYADRYIDQFTELFTEEGRKAVRITHRIPGQQTHISCTNGYNYQAQTGSQQLHQPIATAPSTFQQQQTQPQPTKPVHQNFAVNQSLNTMSPTQLPVNQQLNINLQSGNIVGITSSPNVHQIRQPSQQFFDTAGSVNVQTQPGQQISLTNGSLVLVHQQPSDSRVPTALTIQTASKNQQKAQLVSNANQIAASGGPIRQQMTTNVPILQAQLKAGSIVATQQQIHQQKVTNVNQSNNNQNSNTYVAGFMNVSNSFQQPQQQPHQIQVVHQSKSQNKTTSNAAILSLLNSAPAAMTTTPLGSAFITGNGTQVTQQSQPSQHQTLSAEQLMQQPPRKTNEMIQNMLNNNLRKINMANSCNQTIGGQNRGTNLIAVGLPTDGNASQSVRVTMSSLASQLASPPALMTNSNFGFTSTNNTSNVTISSSNLKILNNTGQRIINGSSLRRESLATAAPSPGSDSNASSTSGASNLGFAMPGLNAILTTSPSSVGDQSQVQPIVAANVGGATTSLTNQALFERLNSSTGTNTNTSDLSPQQPPNVTNLVQNIANVQSPAAPISPLSSPPSQASPQHVQVQQAGQTTTLNLQGIDFQSLQGAMATFPGLQNVQVQIPISLPLSNAPLATGSGNATGNTQHSNQQATSLLVSVPVTSTTQVTNMQSVPGGCNAIVSAVPANGAATQTVVLTNAGSSVNQQSGSMLSLPFAQIFTSVKGLNPQAIRTTSIASGASTNVINANIIQASNLTGTINNTATGQTVQGAVNIGNSTGAASIQLLGTLQQRPRSIHVVGAKQITNRGQLTQRNLPNASSKLSATNAGPIQHIPTTANLTTTPVLMKTQKIQLKLQKQNAASLQQHQRQPPPHSQQQLSIHQQQPQQIQLGGTTLAQNIIGAAKPSANQKRRRSAADVNK